MSESTEEQSFAELLRKSIEEARQTENLIEIFSNMQRALQECRDALEEAGNFNHPRFDGWKMRQVRVEALNALALVQKSGERHDDQNSILFDILTKKD